MTKKRASRALSGSVARSEAQIWRDRISEGDRRRRSAVAMGTARDRKGGQARTGGADVPARLRRSVVRIMVISRR